MIDTLRLYDTGGDGLPIVWHHGTPNVGSPPEPLFRAGLRWVSYDRPGYGGSPARQGRDMASAAAYTASVVDTLGIDRFAVMSHSSGGPHALACAALLPDRVIGAVSMAGLAPFTAEGIDWFAGMAAGSRDSLLAATEGRTAKEHYTESAEFDPDVFTETDLAAFAGEWSWFRGIVNAALKDGPGGLIDDDLANVAPWGFDPARITVPVLLTHGAADRMVPATHSEWLSRACPTARLRLYPNEGHISVLNHATAALDWLSAL